MSYYRGDYYRGDYYRGDLLGSLKRIGRGVVGAVGGFLAGGPIGAVVGGIGGLAGGSSATAPQTSTPLPAPIPIGRLPIIGSSASGMPMVGTMSAAGTAIKVAAKALPYVKKFIAAAGGWVLVDKLTGMIMGPTTPGRRSMNHLNPRALSRATRRVEGFVKKARKAVSPLGYTVVRRGSGRCAPKRRCK